MLNVIAAAVDLRLTVDLILANAYSSVLDLMQIRSVNCRCMDGIRAVKEHRQIPLFVYLAIDFTYWASIQ